MKRIKNKIEAFFEIRKVEIWKLLKEIRIVLKTLIIVFFWTGIIVTIILFWGMVNNANYLIDFLAGKPLYLEVMGNMILIPIKFCFVLWIIDIFVGLYMRIIANRMDEKEMKKAGIANFIAVDNIKVVRSSNLKENKNSKERKNGND